MAVDIGATARYETPDGKRVSAIVFEERANLPHYSVEIVDKGEVVEHFEVLGHSVIADLVRRRRWTEVNS